MKKAHLVILLFAITNFALAFSQHRWIHKEILKYDGSGYYLYLPALIIYQDLGNLAFYNSIDSVYHPSNDIKQYGLYPQENTKLKLNKYAIGTALGELPAFLIMHAYTRYYKTNYPADGYSMPYQFSVGMSNILWTIIGLIVLAAFLRNFFDDHIIALTLFIIGFGTNLFCYTSIEMGLSHTLEFLLFACVLYYTESWYRRPTYLKAILLGIFLGWILIVRPVDFLIFLVPVLWPIQNKKEFGQNRLQFMFHFRGHIMSSLIACFILAAIQLAYWKYITGHFIHFSYQEEFFNFRQPEIVNGLFSFRKGWFIYTPVALIAMMGLFPLYFQNKKFILPILAFFIPFIYVVFSWSIWWYGWGFGARSMIESYAIISIPLAALLLWLWQQKTILKYSGIIIFALCIVLNIFQTRQFRHGLIDGEFATPKSYWEAYKTPSATIIK